MPQHSFITISRGSPERSGDLSVQLQLILGGHRVPRWSGKDTQNTATFLIRFRASVNSFLPRKFLSLLYTIFLSTIKSRQAIENEPRHLFALFLCSSLSTQPVTGKKKPLLPRNEGSEETRQAQILFKLFLTGLALCLIAVRRLAISIHSGRNRLSHLSSNPIDSNWSQFEVKLESNFRNIPARTSFDSNWSQIEVKLKSNWSQTVSP